MLGDVEVLSLGYKYSHPECRDEEQLGPLTLGLRTQSLDLLVSQFGDTNRTLKSHILHWA